MNKKNKRDTFEHEQSRVVEEFGAEAERVYSLFLGFEFRGSGLWFRVKGLEFRNWDLGYGIWCPSNPLKASKLQSVKASKHRSANLLAHQARLEQRKLHQPRSPSRVPVKPEFT